MIIRYVVPETWRVTDVIFIFHFGLFFALLPPFQPKKNEKKRQEISSFYTIVPETMIICHIGNIYKKNKKLLA